MTAHSTNYYGYDKETYKECRGLISETNMRHVEILNVWFFVVNVLCILFSMLDLFELSSDRVPFYAIYGGISIVFFILTKHLYKRQKWWVEVLLVTLTVFLWITYGIQASVNAPYMAATMYMVMVVVLSFSFIATMGTMIIVTGICTAIFIYSSYLTKPAAIAGRDLYNAIVFVTLALIFHFAFQRTRMMQFVTFQKNIQIQRELEIKSSFDALTSLLNRGRFFSLAGNIISGEHDEYMAICLLDLDEFKQINDKLGHQMGDKAIQIAGSTIIETLHIDMSEKWAFQEKVMKEGCSFPGRLGGDEFIVLVRGKNGRDEVLSLLQSMLNALNNVNVGELHGIHASFGVTEITKEDRDIDVAYKRADEALYESKRAGKNQIRFRNANEENDN